MDEPAFDQPHYRLPSGAVVSALELAEVSRRMTPGGRLMVVHRPTDHPVFLWGPPGRREMARRQGYEC